MDIATWKSPLPGLEKPSPLDLSLRRHALIGLGIIAVLIFGLGGWAVFTEIAGAVIANGMVVVDGGSKKVQHPEGGVVKAIFVKNDQQVKAGDVLVRLDDVATRADLDVILTQLRESIGEMARLTAETTNAPTMVIPAIASDWPPDPKLDEIMANQQRLRDVRRASLDSQARQLDEQITQKQSEIAGLVAQQDAVKRQLELYRSENDNLGKLKSKGLVGDQRVNDVKRNLAQLEGQVGSLAAQTAAARASVSELKMQRTQLYADFRSKALADLQTASQTAAELMEKKIAAEERLRRLDIRAPISGTVHDSSVTTVGGVVTAGETLMEIVPQDKHLLVEARVSPLDIDKLHVDQPVDVRLSGFDVRTTPDLTGEVEAISPDLTKDADTGARYYAVRVRVPDSEQKKLPHHARLVPGMPAEAFIQTGDRTVWSYLVHPLVEAVNHTFRQ